MANRARWGCAGGCSTAPPPVSRPRVLRAERGRWRGGRYLVVTAALVASISQVGKKPTATVKPTDRAMAMPVHTGTRTASRAVVGRLGLGEPHRHHDPQVQEGCDHRCDHRDDGDGVALLFDGSLDHRELGDEARRQRHSGLGEQQHGHARARRQVRFAQARGTTSRSVAPSPVRPTIVTTANVPDHQRPRTAAGTAARGSTPLPPSASPARALRPRHR